MALQTWVALAGERRVHIPYASAIAHLLNTRIQRYRRDFPQLLTTIASIALLYQRQRERSADGAIVARVEDYAAARSLLLPVFALVARDSISPPVREAVAAVLPGEVVSSAELVTRLGISKAATSERLAAAISGGWLVNDETRRGHPGRIHLGVPLPDASEPLPTVEAVTGFLAGETPAAGVTATELPAASAMESLAMGNQIDHMTPQAAATSAGDQAERTRTRGKRRARGSTGTLAERSRGTPLTDADHAKLDCLVARLKAERAVRSD